MSTLLFASLDTPGSHTHTQGERGKAQLTEEMEQMGERMMDVTKVWEAGTCVFNHLPVNVAINNSEKLGHLGSKRLH